MDGVVRVGLRSFMAPDVRYMTSPPSIEPWFNPPHCRIVLLFYTLLSRREWIGIFADVSVFLARGESKFFKYFEYLG